VKIIVRKIDIERIKEIEKESYELQTALTTVWQGMIPSYTYNTKSLIGKAFILFRNQGENKNLALLLSGDFVATAELDAKSADIFCKLIQYLFE